MNHFCPALEPRQIGYRRKQDDSHVVLMPRCRAHLHVGGRSTQTVVGGCLERGEQQLLVGSKTCTCTEEFQVPHFSTPPSPFRCPANTAAPLPLPFRPNNAAVRMLRRRHLNNAAAHPPLPWLLSIPAAAILHRHPTNANLTMPPQQCRNTPPPMPQQRQVSLPLVGATIQWVSHHQRQCQCQHQFRQYQH